MHITLLDQRFLVLDTQEKITVADSFVVGKNKLHGGHGEAKLYVGHSNQDIRNFWGSEGFSVNCFLLKKDLFKYLEETKTEYTNPEQHYMHKDALPELWGERMSEVASLPEKVEFVVSEQTQIAGTRVYVKSDSLAYRLIRELSLPNITYISIVKVSNSDGNFYYFRLFADYFGSVVHPHVDKAEQDKIESIANSEQKAEFTRARAGQGQYRKALLELCPRCPITLVSDDRLLIASHIKPWTKCSDFEKTDPLNGFMFTPTFDWLFDKGFLSFTDDKKCILSPFLSPMTYSRLKISNDKRFEHLPTENREGYLGYHRDEILKR